MKLDASTEGRAPTAVQLKALISDALGDHPQPDPVKKLVYHCHRLAVVYLRRKVSGGRLHPGQFSLTLDDLALDSIADLFQRDENLLFPRLSSFFFSVGFPSIGEEECFALTRQLVFSEVNRHLFRLYRECDPSLGKIIRNLKNGIKGFSDLSIERRGDELWLYVLEQGRRRDDLPVISQEVLEIHLADSTSPGDSLKTILSAYRNVLSADKLYACRFPLIGLALIVRTMMSRAKGAEPTAAVIDESLDIDDIEILVDESVEVVRTRMRDSYLDKEKLSATAYDALLAAVHDILVAQYVHNDGLEYSFYEYLHRHMRGLTPSEYRERFRVILEYLSKLTRQELLDAVRKELR